MREYKIESHDTGVLFWKDFLIEKAISIFQYENLPKNLPQEEIEKRIVIDGFCGIFHDLVYGVVTATGGVSGVDLYNHATHFTFAQPVLGGKTLKIGKECEIIYNNKSYTSLYPLIIRTANQLAAIDSSIAISTINSRSTNFITADNDLAYKAVLDGMDKMRQGEQFVVNTRSLLGGIKTLPFSDNKNSALSELCFTRDHILKSFYMTIGLKSENNKRERLTESEVGAETGKNLFNLISMRETRKKCVKKVNSLFGTNIEVNLSPIYDMEV